MSKENSVDNLRQSIRLVLLEAFTDEAVDLDDVSILTDAELDNLFERHYIKLSIDNRVNLHASAWIDEITTLARSIIKNSVQEKMKSMVKRRP